MWTNVLCGHLKYSYPSGTLWNATESAKVIKIRIGTTNVHNSARRSKRKKKGPSVDGEVFKDVRMMSVVSDKQKQAGSSGSAPATPQGNNLPPAVPPPSISRNPLRGSKCNNLHFIPVPCSTIPSHSVVRIQHTTCIRNYWRYLPSTHDKVINSVLDSCWYNVQLTIIALLFVRFLLIFLSSFY